MAKQRGAGPARPRRRVAQTGRLAFVLVSAACVPALAACGSAPAGGDVSTLAVVGTSDVFDSGLIQNVIKPGFHAAYPRYRLDYIPKGTGAAIQFAEAGTASALLVHAASLENQFVAQGYSLERFGRAIFYGDYVLLGPPSDPAGVAAGAPHDIVKAFELIAHAGAAGRADFVSRSGTPGTTVKEHQIWALTIGPTRCTVSAADGGGRSPSAATGACPSTPAPPPWYHSTGLTQAPNVENAAVCNYATVNDCYVLTDRGTFEYLQSQNPPLRDLRIVTRDNAAAAPGGSTLLVNSFHVYALDPSKFAGRHNVQINVAGARALLTYLTSSTAQAAARGYLNGSGDPPFLPDAAPALSVSPLPAVEEAGTPVIIHGSLANVVPGTPPLAHQTVTLNRVATPSPGARVAIATATTAANGSYALTFTPVAHASYTVSTGTIAQIENAALHPVFGDLLSPTSRRVDVTPHGAARTP